MGGGGGIEVGGVEEKIEGGGRGDGGGIGYESGGG